MGRKAFAVECTEIQIGSHYPSHKIHLDIIVRCSAMLLRFQIKLTRDSVCLWDDIEDHTQIIDIDPQEPSQISIMSIAEKYLPSIAGYGHTWDCCLDGAKIAVIEGNCKKITQTTNKASFANGSKLYFKYHSAAY